MKAWIIRWEWSGPHAAVEQPVAAILPSRWRSERVRAIVEALYSSAHYTPDEMLEAMRPSGHNPYPARFSTTTVTMGDGSRVTVRCDDEITCGHNPWLRARIALVRPAPSAPGGIEWDDVLRPTAPRGR